VVDPEVLNGGRQLYRYEVVQARESETRKD